MKRNLFTKMLISFSAIFGAGALLASSTVFADEEAGSTTTPEATLEVKNFEYQYTSDKVFTKAQCTTVNDENNTDKLDFIDVKNAEEGWYLTLDSVDSLEFNGKNISDDGISAKDLYAGKYVIALHQSGKKLITKEFEVKPSTKEVKITKAVTSTTTDGKTTLGVGEDVKFITYNSNNGSYYTPAKQPKVTEDTTNKIVTYTFDLDYRGDSNYALTNSSYTNPLYKDVINCKVTLSDTNYLHLDFDVPTLPGTAEYVINTYDEDTKSYGNWDKTYKVVVNVNAHEGNPYYSYLYTYEYDNEAEREVKVISTPNETSKKYEYTIGEEIFVGVKDNRTDEKVKAKYSDINWSDVDANREYTLDVEYSLDGKNYSRVVPTIEKVGEYTLSYKINSTVFKEEVKGSFNIVIKGDTGFTKNELYYKVDGIRVADGKEVTYTGKPQNVTVYYKGVEVGTFTVEDAKDYDVQEELEKQNKDFKLSDYFKVPEDGIKFTVKKAKITIVPNRTVTTYGTEPKFGYTVASTTISDATAKKALNANGKFKAVFDEKTPYAEGANAGEYVYSLEYVLNEKGNQNFEINCLSDYLVVEKALLIPVAAEAVYTGEVQTPEVYVTIDEKDIALETEVYSVMLTAGIYDVTCYLPEELATNYTLGAYNVVEYEIEKYVVDSTKFTLTGEYTGTKYTLGLDAKICTTNEADLDLTNVGEYEITVTILDDSSTVWEDGTTEAKTFTFVVTKANVTKPVVEANTFTYDKEAHSLAIQENALYTISGNSATNAGTYTVTLSLIAKDRYQWADADSNDITYDLVINKAVVRKPVVETNTFTYDKEEHTLAIQENELYTVTGNSAKDAGTHTVTVSLVDKDNYAWDEADSNDLTFSLIIKKKEFDMSAVKALITEEYSIKVGGNIDAEIEAIRAKLPENVTMTVSGLFNTYTAGKYELVFKFTSNDEFYADPEPITSLLVVKALQASILAEGSKKPAILIESENGIDPDYEIVFYKVVEEKAIKEIKDTLTQQKQITKKQEVAAVYEISLTDEGVSVQPDGTIKIKVLAPEGIKNFKIIHIHEGVAYEIDYTTDGDYIIMTTDKLSSFVFVQNKTSLAWLISVLAVVLAAGIACAALEFLYLNKKGVKLFGRTKAMSIALLAVIPGHIPSIIVLASLVVLVIAANVFLCIKIFNYKSDEGSVESFEKLDKVEVTNE